MAKKPVKAAPTAAIEADRLYQVKLAKTVRLESGLLLRPGQKVRLKGHMIELLGAAVAEAEPVPERA